ncbi:MAG: hypothetical protein KGQ41_08520 [Alphaproteobacteria bacterium]|nr:hypothetical protein [Alphaproteobacteria bacterium]
MESLSENMIFCTLEVEPRGQRFHFESEEYFHHSDRCPCAKFDMPDSGDEAADKSIYTDLGFWLIISTVRRYHAAQVDQNYGELQYYVPVVFIADVIKGRGGRLAMSEERYYPKDTREYCGTFDLPHLDVDILMWHDSLLCSLGKTVYGLLRKKP